MTERASTPPIVWAIAGTDSGGGAGLAADVRAAGACGVHLCPVVAAVTAQNSVAVTRVVPVAPDVLDAQLAALAADMPPVAVKTGLLGSAENVAIVAHWIDALRAGAPVALVVDPVLGSSTGAAFAGADVIAAYRELLLPRATLVTPNRAEAARLAGSVADAAAVPLAAALRALGAAAVCITGGDDAQAQPAHSVDWLDAPHARGWLSLPRVATRHAHGTGCTFATVAAAALGRGFVAADAAVLAKMATAHALRRGYAAGQGAGPVATGKGFIGDPTLLPLLSWGDEPVADCSSIDSSLPRLGAGNAPISSPIGVYAIVDSTARARQVLEAGVGTVQLRIKTTAGEAAPRAEIADALDAAARAGATLVVNDHWRAALEWAAAHPAQAPHLALHLGQEDLLALPQAERAALAASGVRLGISTHSLWELCRARALAPWYVACGPVWPTLTKAMPWRPQGIDNLAWWVRIAGVPVVAIGGILEPAQMRAAAATSAAGVCIVRGLGDVPAETVPQWQAALAAGWADAGCGTASDASTAGPPHSEAAVRWPHPSLSA